MPFDGSISEKARDLLVLQRAREKVAEKWWDGSQCRNAPDGRVCIMLALVRELGWSFGSRDGDNISQHAADLVGFKDFREGAQWNDAQTNVGPVLARFDAAITSLGGAL